MPTGRVVWVDRMVKRGVQLCGCQQFDGGNVRNTRRDGRRLCARKAVKLKTACLRSS